MSSAPARARALLALAACLCLVPHGALVRAAQAPGPAALIPSATPHEERRRSYDVESYDLDLRFDVPRKSVSGSATIRLRPLAGGFDALELDAAELRVERVEVDGRAAKFTVDAPAEKLRVALARPYAASEPLAVTVFYSATPRKGLYFFPASPASPSVPAQFWSQGEADDNHFWFPCWDYPNDKATSRVSMTVASRFVTVSNGTLAKTTANRDGTKTFVWEQTRPHSSYLVMVAGGSFSVVKDAWRGRPVTYVVPPSESQSARRVLGTTPKIMEFFSRRLAFDYPWPKYAQVAVTNFIFGGMENTSATTLADSALAEQGQRVGDTPEDLVSHELAHQWFGDLVTCRDWSHAWLNEGFATYMALVWAEHDGGERAYRSGLALARDKFLSADSGHRRPLVYNVYRDGIDLFLDEQIYNKGAWVLHMLRGHLGEALFWKGVTHYLEKHQYGLVTTDDFRVAMEEATGQQLDWFFDEWVYKSGYPQFATSTAWDAPSKTLTVVVRQKQEGADTPVFRMPADLAITTKAGRSARKVWIDSRENRFTFQLDSKPSSVTFDPDDRILKTLAVEQPATERPQQASARSIARADAGNREKSYGKARESRPGGGAPSL